MTHPLAPASARNRLRSSISTFVSDVDTSLESERKDAKLAKASTLNVRRRVVRAHAKIRIGDSIIEMGEAHGQWGPMPATIHLYVSDTDAVYRQAMAAGAAKSLSEPADQPYGDRMAGVEDACGNRWYIATHMGK